MPDDGHRRAAVPTEPHVPSPRPVSVVPPRVTEPQPGDDQSPVQQRTGPWLARYARALLVLDLLSASGGATAAYWLRFGSSTDTHGMALHATISVGVPVVWVAAMALGRAYEQRFLGLGSEEFKRVGNAAVRVTALVALVSYAARLDLARGFVIIALPLATALSVGGRLVARAWLHRQRRQGRCVHRAVVVGQAQSVAKLVQQVRRTPHIGFRITGACVVGMPASVTHELGIPTFAGLGRVLEAVERTQADTVAVASGNEMDGPALRRLAWSLEGTGVALLVSPALTDIAGTRISIRPVSGLPLLHVEEPQMSGGRRTAKAVLDCVVAGVSLLLLAPLLGVIALSVAATSPGPVLFRQRRVGRGGEDFVMLKFRSMFTDAEARLPELAAVHRGEGPLFKMRDDPRVTRVGRVLRRYSLDELPQLVNVLRNDMSLVGPRPPLRHEVDTYGDHVHRRLMVKPGLTGLWQVSGRSDLPWDEAVRLDLHYVENWSLALDLMIIGKTLQAVMGSRGAY